MEWCCSVCIQWGIVGCYSQGTGWIWWLLLPRNVHCVFMELSPLLQQARSVWQRGGWVSVVGGERMSSWGPLVAALCLSSLSDWGMEQMTMRRKERLKTRTDRERVDPHGQHSHRGEDREKDRPTCLTPINHVCMCLCMHVCAGVCVCKSPPWPNWWLIMLSFPVEEVYKSLEACWVPLGPRMLHDQTFDWSPNLYQTSL